MGKRMGRLSQLVVAAVAQRRLPTRLPTRCRLRRGQSALRRRTRAQRCPYPKRPRCSRARGSFEARCACLHRLASAKARTRGLSRWRRRPLQMILPRATTWLVMAAMVTATVAATATATVAARLGRTPPLNRQLATCVPTTLRRVVPIRVLSVPRFIIIARRRRIGLRELPRAFAPSRRSLRPAASRAHAGHRPSCHRTRINGLSMVGRLRTRRLLTSISRVIMARAQHLQPSRPRPMRRTQAGTRRSMPLRLRATRTPRLHRPVGRRRYHRPRWALPTSQRLR